MKHLNNRPNNRPSNRRGNRRRGGQEIELQVAQALEKREFEIVARNLRFPRSSGAGEIDILAWGPASWGADDHRVLYAIEVKSTKNLIADQRLLKPEQWQRLKKSLCLLQRRYSNIDCRLALVWADIQSRSFRWMDLQNFE